MRFNFEFQSREDLEHLQLQSRMFECELFCICKKSTVIPYSQRNLFLIPFKLKEYDRGDSFSVDYEPNGSPFMNQPEVRLAHNHKENCISFDFES